MTNASMTTRPTLIGGSILLLIALAGALASSPGMADAERDGPAYDDGRARNVILLIGDGMDERIITATRNYQYGADGKLPGLDGFLLTGDKTTHSVEEDAPKRNDCDPDSASTGTAWATGFKTSDARVGSLPGSTGPYGDPETLMELAERKGLRAGNVTTADVTDATPAVQMAHVPLRSCRARRT